MTDNASRLFVAAGLSASLMNAGSDVNEASSSALPASVSVSCDDSDNWFHHSEEATSPKPKKRRFTVHVMSSQGSGGNSSRKDRSFR